MTARELYEQSCYLVYENPYDDEELREAFPSILNQIMAVCMPYENQFRRLRNQEKLISPPVLSQGAELDSFEIPFCDEIAGMAMPYAVQSKFLEADDDKKAEAVMAYKKFADRINDITPAVEMEDSFLYD